MRDLLRNLFPRWVIAFSTQDIGDFYKVKIRLNQHQVDYKTDSVTFKGGFSGRSRYATTYHIKVKEEDLRLTSDIIHR
ncbi:hypothetical protein [Lentibacillus juripiscarius]|uniref:Uncharacterized protein n=1 Tax=Lentibacillus juripiscarius TaxID=257446 RepID=A0ABW5VD26_9BACI